MTPKMTIAAVLLAYMAALAAFFGGGIYVVLHFITKFW